MSKLVQTNKRELTSKNMPIFKSMPGIRFQATRRGAKQDIWHKTVYIVECIEIQDHSEEENIDRDTCSIKGLAQLGRMLTGGNATKGIMGCIRYTTSAK